MRIVTWGLWYWPVFLITASVAFLIPEILALVTNVSNTLSDYAWHELNIPRPGTPVIHSAAWLLTLGVWLVMAFWLTWHIWFRKFT